MALADLIAELQSATKPDRKLDGALAIFAGYTRIVEVEKKPDGQTEQKIKWIPPGDTKAIGLPFFTNSIDAARALTEVLGPTQVAGCTWESNLGTAKIDDGRYCLASTPALALCIAALTRELSKEIDLQ